MPKNLCVRKAPGYDPADENGSGKGLAAAKAAVLPVILAFSIISGGNYHARSLLIYFGKEYIITLHNLKNRSKEEKDDKYS